MTNNAPDYEDNLAFEPVKTAGTIEMVTKDGKAVAIRCYIDNQHYFDLALYDVPETMDWHDAKCWCEKNYCRLPMKHEWEFVIANIKRINKMLEKVGGEPLKKSWYWSSSEYDNLYAWYSSFYNSYGLDWYGKNASNQYVRPAPLLERE